MLSSLVVFEIEYRTAVDRLLARAEKLRSEARGMLKTHVTMLAWHVAESVAELGEAVGAEVSLRVVGSSSEAVGAELGAELGEAELGAELGEAELGAELACSPSPSLDGAALGDDVELA